MLTPAEAARFPESVVGAETRRLGAHLARLPAGVVVPPAFEETFYRGANLPEQLRTLLAPINPARVDEDLLEPLAERAQALIRTSALSDDAVQLFYRALGNAGLTLGEVHARRPGGREVETARVTPPGTPALHALKRLWARDWTFDAVLARLDETGSVGLEARATLLFAGPPGQPDPGQALELGVPTALVGPLGLVGLP